MRRALGVKSGLSTVSQSAELISVTKKNHVTFVSESKPVSGTHKWEKWFRKIVGAEKWWLGER